MRQSVEERAGGDHHRLASDIAPVHQTDPAHTPVFDHERRHFGLLNLEILFPLQYFLHADAVLLLIALRARRPYGRAAAGIQQAKLDADGVRHFAHHPAQRVDLPHKVALGNSSDGRIAGHLRYQIGIHGDHGGAHSHTRAGAGRLAAGVPPTHHHHVIRTIGHCYHCSRTKHIESFSYRRRRP